MPDVKARISKLSKEIRCGLPDCNKLLFTGDIKDAAIRIKCDCGAMNSVIVDSQEVLPKNNLHKPDGQMNGRSYQERIGMTRKSK